MYSGLGYSSYHIGEPSLISKLYTPALCYYDYAVLLLISLLINYMQTVLEQGSIDKPLTFDVGLIQLSFVPV